MCIMSGAGLLVVLLFLPRGAPPAATTPAEGRSFGLSALVGDSTMQALIVYMAAWGLAYGAVSTFLPVFLTEVRGATLAQVGIVLSVRSVLNGTLNYPYGRLADRLNRVLLVTVGLVAMAAGICLIPLAGGFAGAVVLFAGMGMLETVAMPAGNAITVETGRRLGMGSVMSLFNMANSAAVIVGAMGGAAIESSAGIARVFPAAAVAVVAGAVGFNLLMRRARASG
jgi:DHA1 family multidrug resistance protein-like MFS transporter